MLPTTPKENFNLVDLLLDAETELRSIEMFSLARAVRIACDHIAVKSDVEVNELDKKASEPVKNEWGVPAFDVACPECKAPVGKPCVNENGGHLFDGHVPRMPAVHGARCIELKKKPRFPLSDREVDRQADANPTKGALEHNWIVQRFAAAIRKAWMSSMTIGREIQHDSARLEWSELPRDLSAAYMGIATRVLREMVETFPKTFADFARELGLTPAERDARDA